MQIDKLRGKSLDQLFNSILSLKDLEECYRFFDDLCTINEIQSLSQRLEVARMLREGNTYHKIETETGASTATISRVKRCLNYGNDAYTMALDRVAEQQANDETKFEAQNTAEACRPRSAPLQRAPQDGLVAWQRASSRVASPLPQLEWPSLFGAETAKHLDRRRTTTERFSPANGQTHAFEGDIFRFAATFPSCSFLRARRRRTRVTASLPLRGAPLSSPFRARIFSDSYSCDETQTRAPAPVR